MHNVAAALTTAIEAAALSQDVMQKLVALVQSNIQATKMTWSWPLQLPRHTKVTARSARQGPESFGRCTPHGNARSAQRRDAQAVLEEERRSCGCWECRNCGGGLELGSCGGVARCHQHSCVQVASDVTLGVHAVRGSDATGGLCSGETDAVSGSIFISL